jgi:hypothetical protein
MSDRDFCQPADVPALVGKQSSSRGAIFVSEEAMHATALGLAHPALGRAVGWPRSACAATRPHFAGRLTADEPLPYVVFVPSVAHDGFVAESFVGRYVQGFETSAFTLCSGAPWTAWLQSEDPSFFVRYHQLVADSGVNPLEGLTVLVEVTGRLELAEEGQLGFGHLGQYRAQLTVEKLSSMAPGECPP